MPEYDLLVRGANPLPEIGITDGVIAGFTAASAREEIDATGLMVMPGVIDAHVHFNEPGRTEWEGWATGSRGAVAGGVTTVCDMPLNSHPPVVTADAFDAKRRAAEAQSICDFALWGGLIPGHLGDLDALAARGVIGFKAFMSGSGIDDFPKVDLDTLRDGMRRAAMLGLPVAVHAELDPEDRVNGGARARAEAVSGTAANRDSHDGALDLRSHATTHLTTGTSVADYLASRPVDSECAAIRAALAIAEDTGCALHVVHVSSGRGVALIAEARARGVDVTAETCPHYLVFTGDDMVRLGAVAKCAPPFRDAAERAALIDHVRAGRVDTIGSDHSPSPWTMKTDANFFRVWGGIAGVQHLLPLLLTESQAESQAETQTGSQTPGMTPGLAAGLTPDLIARLTAANVARRFRFPAKGTLAVGHDADLTLIEMNSAAYEVTAESLFYRHRVSPYVGRTLRARVRRTLRRGHTVFHDGRITTEGGGRLLTPSPRVA